MHYITNTYVEKGDMILGDAPCGCLESCQRRVTWTIFTGENGEKNVFGSSAINTLSHQCIVGERWSVTKVCLLVWPRSLSKGSDSDKLFYVKMGKDFESICTEGEGHIFTFDLIFWGSTCHGEGYCIQ